MKSYSATDVGQKRKINQDSVFASDAPIGNLPNLYIVADGMGGHNAGDFASRYAVNVVRDYIASSSEKNPVKLINEAIRLANKGIIEEAAAHEEMYGMGTTIVVTTVIEHYAYTANVGDSRLYLFDDGKLTQITKDHSLVEEMVRLGEITEEDARTHPDKNIITRAVEIRNLIARNTTLREKTEQLIEAANDNGGKDNIAVVLIKPDADEVDETC